MCWYILLYLSSTLSERCTSECILERDGTVLVHIPTINYNNSTILRQKNIVLRQQPLFFLAVSNSRRNKMFLYSSKYL